MNTYSQQRLAKYSHKTNSLKIKIAYSTYGREENHPIGSDKNTHLSENNIAATLT